MKNRCRGNHKWPHPSRGTFMLTRSRPLPLAFLSNDRQPIECVTVGSRFIRFGPWLVNASSARRGVLGFYIGILIYTLARAFCLL